jgi:uncharacterized protein YllA (UPF0747 family)
MRYEDLPGIPNIWIDFANSKLPLLPGPCDLSRIQAVAEVAGKAPIQNFTMDFDTGSVAVVVNFYASLLGGPVSQILKCLTAIKVCAELKKEGIAASPVCWIHSSPPSGFSPHTLKILDRSSEIHCFELVDDERTQLLQSGALPQRRIAEIVAEIERLGSGGFDKELLELLSSFKQNENLVSANAQWIALLLKEWGITVIDSGTPAVQNAWNEAHAFASNRQDRIQVVMKKQMADLAVLGYPANPQNSAIPSCLIQSLVIPTAAFVADPLEIYDFAKASPLYEELGIPQPLIWPSCSATMMNSRSRRTLDRYALHFSQLFAGEQNVMELVRNFMKNKYKVPEIFEELKADAEICMMVTGASVSPDKRFPKIQDRCRKRILYQLEKLQRHCTNAAKTNEQTAMRKIHRTCNWLAPNGRLQETELGGIQLPLRYAGAGLRLLYEKLDVRNFEHQIIDMD